jgi:hypothetical protein
MCGNFLVVVSIFDIAAHHPGLLPAVIGICIVGALSFSCALILRARIVKSIRECRSPGPRHPLPDVDTPKEEC